MIYQLGCLFALIIPFCTLSMEEKCLERERQPTSSSMLGTLPLLPYEITDDIFKRIAENDLTVLNQFLNRKEAAAITDRFLKIYIPCSSADQKQQLLHQFQSAVNRKLALTYKTWSPAQRFLEKWSIPQYTYNGPLNVGQWWNVIDKDTKEQVITKEKIPQADYSIANFEQPIKIKITLPSNVNSFSGSSFFIADAANKNECVKYLKITSNINTVNTGDFDKAKVGNIMLNSCINYIAEDAFKNSTINAIIIQETKNEKVISQLKNIVTKNAEMEYAFIGKHNSLQHPTEKPIIFHNS